MSWLIVELIVAMSPTMSWLGGGSGGSTSLPHRPLPLPFPCRLFVSPVCCRPPVHLLLPLWWHAVSWRSTHQVPPLATAHRHPCWSLSCVCHSPGSLCPQLFLHFRAVVLHAFVAQVLPLGRERPRLYHLDHALPVFLSYRSWCFA